MAGRGRGVSFGARALSTLLIMRTALYGGTFDPIHHGHLILAREAMERLSLDRVVFIPAAQSPHKPGTRSAAAELRLQMVREAIRGQPGFECDQREILASGVSYTIETVRAWKQAAPGDELYYLIGGDNVAELTTWREIETLRSLVKFVVFEREGHECPHAYLRVTRHIDISATEVRKRVAAGKSIRYLVPESVREIIVQHQIYQGDSLSTQNS
jgi:nicotinate-nucleotide adenylyltransferase